MEVPPIERGPRMTKRDNVDDRQPNPRYSRAYEKLPGCSTDHR